MLDLVRWLREKNSIVILDGGMGTMLEEAGWRPPLLPEEMNLVNPDAVRKIHEAYLEAGALLIETNTFGGSAVKLSHRGLAGETRKINRMAASLARKAAGGRALVAGSIGPSGRLVEPLGTLAFEEAVSSFLPQVQGLLDGGADFFLVETMIDLREAKAAVMAIKDAGKGLPFVVSFTFDRNGCTMTGTPPEVAMAWAAAVGASGVGVNCGTGPEDTVETVRRLRRAGELPVFAYPNGGLPSQGAWLAPDPFAEACAGLAEAGATVIGGCCGTTPRHIQALSRRLAGIRPVPGSPRPQTVLASRTRISLCGEGEPLLVVGERINPSRKGPLREAMIARNWAQVREEARLQAEAGADVIDINGGIPGQDRMELISAAVTAVEGAVNLPLSIDSEDPQILEKIARSVAGIPLLNSVTCEPEVLERGLSAALKTGSAVVVLTMDSKGIPDEANGRLALAERAAEAGEKIGLPRKMLFVDPLTLAAGAGDRNARLTLESLRGLSSIGTRSILGISNISFGLPKRSLINRTFLAMAMSCGLDAVIANPLDEALMSCAAAGNVLAGRDPGARRYIALYSGKESSETPSHPLHAEPSFDMDLTEAILRGEKEAAISAGRAFLGEGGHPMGLIQDRVLPALEEVGRLYECGDFFLPQLLASSEAAQAVCRLAEESLLAGGKTLETRGTVLLATVEGDLHDLGKNVVAMVLKSRGYKVVDAGKDVPAERILEAAVRERADLVGLSALMTTTVERMGEVISMGRARGMSCRFILGGAAVSADFAEKIGADGYARDAIEAARLVDRLLAQGNGGE
ncbi:MAG: dihydropteroate synthase [Synergistaceae bacterium]|nr:dihydropteroate synthase [Synergistaceae bacterium]